MLKSSSESTISVIVPVYGTEQYLDRCLNSLLNQSYPYLEIIVVNDGSPGNVADKMAEYKKDSRVSFVDNKENRGLLRTRVCGAKHATGDYIAFVDSDDYVSFDFYRSLLARAQETDSDITIGKTVWENNGDRYIYNYHEAALSFDTIRGEQIKESFFGQEYQCYSWHTIWNKLYKKELWDKCAAEFGTVEDHVIMTEDIYFSSILFFNAKVISRVNHDAYFYCVNETASTNSKRITIERYLKNVNDIGYVFSKVESYLIQNHAPEEVINGFKSGRMHYARMWRNLATHTFSGEQQSIALENVKQIDPSESDESESIQDYFFESVKTPWKGGLEYIKEQLRDSKEEYISFDIFDTLIKRPFYDPQDMFLLLDDLFSKITGNSISFSKIRQEGELLARSYYGNKMAVDDINLDEIYDFIIDHYGISRSDALRMKEKEYENELYFCTARQAGKELLQLAHTLGKHIVLITDMYLRKSVIEKLLKKCGITEYDSIFVSCEERTLKYNGRLFLSALTQLKIESDNLLHIGDSWKSDIEGSNLVGIRNIFFPKATEVFENKISGATTNHCSDIGQSVCGENVNYIKSNENLGIRCMKAMAANYYFDNPYRAFHCDSDFNADPYFIGYYLLGMHMIGLAKWIDVQIQNSRYKHLIFLARDGYLPMRVYSIYGSCKDSSYVQASRKAVMPVMIKDTLNLYQLPIEYRAHSPKSLVQVLSFLGETNDEFGKELESKGIVQNRPFADIEEYHNFIKIYIKHCYDKNKHDRARLLVEKYYKKIPQDSIAFDMGYSGRIQSAICEASGKPIDVLFLHEDYMSSIKTKHFANFEIMDFYQYYPEISGLIREHIFSDSRGSCIGFGEADGDVIPLFEEERHKYPDKAIVRLLQNGAVDFAKQFTEYFNSYSMVNDFSPVVASYPFEGFLRKPSKMDMHIFSESYFEDMVFGANANINIEQFAMNNLALMGWNPKTQREVDDEKRLADDLKKADQENSRILDMINTSSQIKRAFLWLILDWKFFKEKMKINYDRWNNKK